LTAGMGTKQIRVSEDLYARVQSENREEETLGETLERLVDDYSLLDFADDAADLDLDRSVEDAVDGAVGVTPPEHTS
jgi:predicted CopG family antitoxin